MSSIAIDSFIQGASRLPVMPKATVRLLELLEFPDCTTQELAEVIETEPALAVKILKVANSPFYGQRGRIASVARAALVLGAKTIRSLAMAVWTYTLKAQMLGADEMRLMVPLLQHGLATGVAAQMLAEKSSRPLAEDAFMAGLLHDIGRVALVAQLGMRYQGDILDPAVRNSVPLHEMEATILGFDHRALGARLMSVWGLPDFLAAVAEHHHDTTLVPNARNLAAAVALADNCASLLGFNLAMEIPRPPQAEIAAFYGLADELVMIEFLESCADRVKQFNDALDGP
ncbi:MAG: HDOD domain-containing protein [Pseudomonadota bacterium]